MRCLGREEASWKWSSNPDFQGWVGFRFTGKGSTDISRGMWEHSTIKSTEVGITSLYSVTQPYQERRVLKSWWEFKSGKSLKA